MGTVLYCHKWKAAQCLSKINFPVSVRHLVDVWVWCSLMSVLYLGYWFVAKLFYCVKYHIACVTLVLAIRFNEKIGGLEEYKPRIHAGFHT